MTKKGRILTFLTVVLSIVAGLSAAMISETTLGISGEGAFFGFLLALVFVWWVYSIVIYSKKKK